MPSPRLATVMPSCAVAMKRSWRRGLARTPRTTRAMRLPCWARRSIAARGTPTMANSAATNSAFSASSATMMRIGTSSATTRSRDRHGCCHVVGHLAEERPQHVLERDDAEGAAVVADDGVMRPALLEQREEPIAGSRRAGGHGRLDDIGEGGRQRALQPAQGQALGVDDPDDMRALALEHRHARELALRQAIDHLP